MVIQILTCATERVAFRSRLSTTLAASVSYGEYLPEAYIDVRSDMELRYGYPGSSRCTRPPRKGDGKKSRSIGAGVALELRCNVYTHRRTYKIKQYALDSQLLGQGQEDR